MQHWLIGPLRPLRPYGGGGGGEVQWDMKARSENRRRRDLPMMV